jgi:hypothetical protein
MKRGKIRKGNSFQSTFDFSLLLDPGTDTGSFLVLVRRRIIKGHFGIIAEPHTREGGTHVAHGAVLTKGGTEGQGHHMGRTAPCSQRRSTKEERRTGCTAQRRGSQKGRRGTRAPQGAHGAVLPEKEHQKGERRTGCTARGSGFSGSNTNTLSWVLRCAQHPPFQHPHFHKLKGPKFSSKQLKLHFLPGVSR